MAKPGLRQRNLEFFERLAPKIYEPLCRWEAEQAANRAATEPSAEAPVFNGRVSLGAVRPDGRDPYLHGFVTDLLLEARRIDAALFTDPFDPVCPYVLLVGAGSAAAVEALLDRTRCVYLFVAAPNAGDLYRSLDEVDWVAVTDRMLSRGGSIHFHLDEDPASLTREVLRTFSSEVPFAFDGTTITAFAHRDYAVSITQSLSGLGYHALSTLGPFYDECLMLRNAEANLRLPGARLYHNRTGAEPGLPAWIVGSGPSLDTDIAFIRENRDKAAIISCGSALGPLLAAGIRPDLQVELENIGVTTVLLPTARAHDITGIPLLAPSTVDPEAAAAFEKIIFCFRQNLSNHPLYDVEDSAQPLLAEPTVVNLALAFAREQNFPEIVLFGVDMGAKDPTRDHAQGTWHTQPGSDYRLPNFDIVVPANFGGTCRTSRGLFQALHAMVHAVRTDARLSGRRYVNTSDGARIEGAEALHSTDLRPQTPDRPKAEVFDEVLARFAPWDTGRMPTPWPGPTIRKAVRRQFDAVMEVFRNIGDFRDKSYLPRLAKVLNYAEGHSETARRGAESTANMVVRGTVGAMILFMEYHLNRVVDEDKVNILGQAAVAALGKAMERLYADVEDRLGGDAVVNVPHFEDVFLADTTPFPQPPRPDRNAPCPCGSGKRYKACHGRTR